jgi:hypothetical protein
VTWRRVALAISWIAAAGWGIYYLAAFASGNAAFVAAAIAHFVFGYAWAHAIVARPLTMPLALFGILCAGAFTRLAFGLGTAELYFAWAGPFAAVALADATRARHVGYAVLAFALGFLALIWLSA